MFDANGKYDVLEEIGRGSFGVIRKVRRKSNGFVLCRKEINYSTKPRRAREQLQAEFQILSALRHPNIVRCYYREYLETSRELHVYMEYCSNGDLGGLIRDLTKKNEYAEESFVWSVFVQLVAALYRCHYGAAPPEVGKTGMGAAKPKVPQGGITILHRDLKPENVFLGADNSVKLGDFGLAKRIQRHEFASSRLGTPFYMSPEIWAAEKYNLKSDIWSLGCTMYELCSRQTPFDAETDFQLVRKIKGGKIAPLPSVYSPELVEVIKSCLRTNPDHRPDTASLLGLPIVQLIRREQELVEITRTLQVKEDAVNTHIQLLDQKKWFLDNERVRVRQEIDDSLRREWEVKAQLEIQTLVKQEIERLQGEFQQEVQSRVKLETFETQRLLQQEIERLQEEFEQEVQSRVKLELENLRKMSTQPSDATALPASSAAKASDLQTANPQEPVSKDGERLLANHANREEDKPDVAPHRYLQPGFDPNTLAVPFLRNILLTHDVGYPSTAKKAYLVRLFQDRIVPIAADYLAAQGGVQRSSRGIEDAAVVAEAPMSNNFKQRNWSNAPVPNQADYPLGHSLKGKVHERQKETTTKAKTVRCPNILGHWGLFGKKKDGTPKAVVFVVRSEGRNPVGVKRGSEVGDTVKDAYFSQPDALQNDLGKRRVLQSCDFEISGYACRAEPSSKTPPDGAALCSFRDGSQTLLSRQVLRAHLGQREADALILEFCDANNLSAYGGNGHRKEPSKVFG